MENNDDFLYLTLTKREYFAGLAMELNTTKDDDEQHEQKATDERE